MVVDLAEDDYVDKIADICTYSTALFPKIAKILKRREAQKYLEKMFDRVSNLYCCCGERFSLF